MYKKNELIKDGINMNRELQDRADRIERELKEALVPIREELKRLKNGPDDSYKS